MEPDTSSEEHSTSESTQRVLSQVGFSRFSQSYQEQLRLEETNTNTSIETDLRERLNRNNEQMISNEQDSAMIREQMNQERARARFTHRQSSCNNCNGNHTMHKCEMFKRMNLRQRRARVSELNLCANCFMKTRGNDQHQCRFGVCRRCNQNQRHNSLLCPANQRR